MSTAPSVPITIPIAKPLIGEEEVKRASEVMRTGQLSHGAVTEEFERALATYHGYKYSIAVNSGTAALHVALMGLDVKPKDIVGVPDFTFIATSNAASYVGARIKFLDVDKKTFNLNPKKAGAFVAKAKTNPKIKALMPVSLYGQWYDADEIVKTATENGVPVISDNAQAVGAEWNGSRHVPGTHATLSFYPTKNMTTGEGGAILTDDEAYATKCRILRNIGQRNRYEYLYVGYNYRMPGPAAAVGLEQLKKLDSWTARRRENAKLYDELLGSRTKGIKTPFVDARAGHVYHQYTITVADGKRDALAAHLASKGIGSGLYYPQALHTQNVYQNAGHPSANCPVTEKITKEALSIPVHPSVTLDDVRIVADAIKEFAKTH